VAFFFAAFFLAAIGFITPLGSEKRKISTAAASKPSVKIGLRAEPRVRLSRQARRLFKDDYFFFFVAFFFAAFFFAAIVRSPLSDANSRARHNPTETTYRVTALLAY
jgi:hypothetical protein